jgi:hypothetical protein
MNPIFDSAGLVVAWLKDDRILNMHGKHIALVCGKSVITYTGVQVGNFGSGIFRDSHGHSVAWIRGAEGEPLRPVPSVPPAPPVPGVPPVPPVPPVPWVPPVPSSSWSSRDWTAFIAGNG